MSDNIKIVIEIDETTYKDIKKGKVYSSMRDVPQESVLAIAHGIPLDTIKAGIEKLNPVDYGSMFSYESHNGARDMQSDILDILDNIGKAESEDK